MVVVVPTLFEHIVVLKKIVLENEEFFSTHFSVCELMSIVSGSHCKLSTDKALIVGNNLYN